MSIAHDNDLSDAAHLGGMIGATAWILLGKRVRGAVGGQVDRINRGAWERKLRQQADEQAQVDRILDKVRNEGLDSLTRKERKALKDATRRQREDERAR